MLAFTPAMWLYFTHFLGGSGLFLSKVENMDDEIDTKNLRSQQVVRVKPNQTWKRVSLDFLLISFINI